MLLTERGRPLAVLRPIWSGDREKSAIQRLEASGFLRPALKRTVLPAWKPRPIHGRHLSKMIRQERDRQ